METLIKESGIAAIREQAKATLEKNIVELSDEANRHLINAGYTEALLPTVEAQIAQYKAEISVREKDIEAALKGSENLSQKEKYTTEKLLKPLKREIESFEKGIAKLEERIKTAKEKIESLRYDAQANMHRIAYIKDLTPESLSASLITHIEGLKQVEAPKEEPAQE